MANVSLAMEGLAIEGRWSLFGVQGEDTPPHPDELEPLAVLQLGG
jgi:hypothetical protein